MTYAPEKRFDRSYEHFLKAKRRFRNLNVDPKFKVKVKGVKICVRMERPGPYTYAYQIWRLHLKRHRSYEHFSKPKRRFRNLNTDPKFKVKVTGVKFFVCMERPFPFTHAYQIWRLCLKGHRSYEHFSKPKCKVWRKDGQTNGRTDSPITMCPLFFERGHKNIQPRITINT